MKKIIVFLTLLFFASTSLGWSSPLPYGLSPASLGNSPVNWLRVPEEFGTLKEVFQGEGSLLIAHIQDAHANYEAQSSIRNVLEYLTEKHGFSLVALEGADRPLYPRAYHFFPYPDINLKIAENLARRGELSGAEMFALELHEKKSEIRNPKFLSKVSRIPTFTARTSSFSRKDLPLKARSQLILKNSTAGSTLRNRVSIRPNF